MFGTKLRATMGGAGHFSVILAAACLGLSCSSLEGARAYRSGTGALERGDTAVAVAELERASLLLPTTSEVHNQLGVARIRAGNIDLAVLAFEKASVLDCENTAAASNLARARAEQRGESADVDFAPQGKTDER